MFAHGVSTPETHSRSYRPVAVVSDQDRRSAVHEARASQSTSVGAKRDQPRSNDPREDGRGRAPRRRTAENDAHGSGRSDEPRRARDPALALGLAGSVVRRRRPARGAAYRLIVGTPEQCSDQDAEHLPVCGLANDSQQQSGGGLLLVEAALHSSFGARAGPGQRLAFMS